MAHTNHMRYSNNVIGKDDPQLSISMRDKSSATIPLDIHSTSMISIGVRPKLMRWVKIP